jgi:hypothetical protein
MLTSDEAEEQPFFYHYKVTNISDDHDR